MQGAWFSELFAAKTRTSGASLAYQLSAVVSGFTPLVATALYAGSAGSARRCCSASTACWACVAALVTRETWGPAEREEVERAGTRAITSASGSRARPPPPRTESTSGS